MKACQCCGKSKSEFVFNNKKVCLQCDELLFDLEIELEAAGESRPEGGKVIPFKERSQPGKTADKPTKDAPRTPYVAPSKPKKAA